MKFNPEMRKFFPSRISPREKFPFNYEPCIYAFTRFLLRWNYALNRSAAD